MPFVRTKSLFVLLALFILKIRVRRSAAVAAAIKAERGRAKPSAAEQSRAWPNKAEDNRRGIKHSPLTAMFGFRISVSQPSIRYAIRLSYQERTGDRRCMRLKNFLDQLSFNSILFRVKDDSCKLNIYTYIFTEKSVLLRLRLCVFCFKLRK